MDDLLLYQSHPIFRVALAATVGAGCSLFENHHHGHGHGHEHEGHDHDEVRYITTGDGTVRLEVFEEGYLPGFDCMWKLAQP